MVGRLVEDERIPLAREQRGERDALLLPARQLVGRRVEQAAHAEAREHRFALPLLPSRPSHTAARTVPAGSTGSCGSAPTRALRPRRTTPASGSRSPLIIASSVLLPQPLRPTTPIRSPSLRVSERSVNSGRFGRDAPSPCASIRITTHPLSARRARCGRILVEEVAQHRVEARFVLLEQQRHVEERLGRDREELGRVRRAVRLQRRPVDARRAAPRTPRCTPRPTRRGRRGPSGACRRRSRRACRACARTRGTRRCGRSPGCGPRARPRPTRAAPGPRSSCASPRIGMTSAVTVPAHRPRVDTARLHRRRVHDDRADLAVLVGAQTEHEHRGLHRDRRR